MGQEPVVVEGELLDDICESCGQPGGEWVTDPYAAELYDEEVMMCLCGGCYEERVLEI